MLIKKLILAFLIFFSVDIYAQNTWIVENINFLGLKSFTQDEALKKIMFIKGQNISRRDIQNSVKSLFSTGKFNDIKVLYSGHTITFVVKERPLISRIIITGNKNIDFSILNQYLDYFNIKTGSTLNLSSIKRFINSIENIYHELGRYKTTCHFSQRESSSDKIDLKIEINEGELSKISNIKILGNKTFDENSLLSLFELKNSNFLWNLLRKNVYSETVLRNDLRTLSNFYLNRGYIHFYVNNLKVFFSKNKSDVRILINIFEGKKYRVSNFFINGNLENYSKLIKNMIHIDKNEIYNKQKINSIKNNIQSLLFNYGYINSKVVVDEELNYNNHTVFLNFNVDLNKRYFVNKISFIGNNITKDAVLRNEIKQKEGDFVNFRLIKLGKESLEKTKFFKNVKVVINEVPNHANHIDIKYIVSEQKTGSLNFGLGYGIDNGISANFSLYQNNLFGTGNSLQSQIIKNKNQKYIDLSILHPHFFSNFVDLNNRFFFSNIKDNSNNFSNSINRIVGFSNNLIFLIDNKHSFNIGLGYTRSSVISENNLKNVFSKTKVLDKKFIKNVFDNNFSINYSWVYDDLKYFYFPISGKKISISGKHTLPFSDNHFYKFTLDSEKYFPLNYKNSFIFFAHISAGFGNGFNSEKLPVYENFIANDFRGIRGFRSSIIGPKIISKISNSDICTGHKDNGFCKSLNSLGGNSMILANLEVVVPIPLIDKKYTNRLRSSLFLDVGGIWNNNWKPSQELIGSTKLPDYNSSNHIYASTGLSLRWFSPLGPLVFSFSYPLQKNQNDQTELFQLSIGKNW